MTAVLSEEQIDERSPSGSPRPRRSSAKWTRRRAAFLPYGLLLPVMVCLTAGLLYPLFRLLVMSLQDYDAPQLYGQPAEWIGFSNFSDILGDSYFWEVLRRSLLFSVACVVTTLLLGTLLAVLMGRLAKVMRTGLSVALILAWSVPPLSSTVIWQWIFDSNSGVANWTLTRLGFDFEGHSWLSEPLSFFFVAAVVVVWMGVPFITFTLHAAMTQIPNEVLEAAEIDGAGAWERFRDVVWPAIRPVFLLLTVLSIVWDLKVFTQIYVLQQAGGKTSETNLLGTWGFREAMGGQHFGKGAAIAIVFVIITLLLTSGLVRRMFRSGEAAPA